MTFWQKIFYFFYGSIKNKLITNVILIHAILMGLVVYDLVDRQSSFMEKQLESKGQELSSLLALNASPKSELPRNSTNNKRQPAIDQLIHSPLATTLKR